MICINPMAPFCDRARGFPSLSTCITARIQCSGTAKRLDASVTNAAKGLGGEAAAFRAFSAAGSACAAPLSSIDDTNITTMHTKVPRDRKAAIVLPTVKAEAVTRRTDDSSGAPMSVTAARSAAGTEE
jgi:hypothetical protein